MRASQSFQRLFNKASTGKIVQWGNSVSDPLGDQSVGDITTTWGQVGGAMQTTVDRVKSGKNLGKANATNAFQQALAEAKAKWEKQKTTRRYVESYADAVAGKVDAGVEGGTDVTLAKVYGDHFKKVTYPAWASTKLDGHRCVAQVLDGEVTLWSRTRKAIVSMPHIIAQLTVLGLDDCFIDGELFSDAFKQDFEGLTSMIRPEYARPGHESIEYRVFDVVKDEPFPARYTWLQEHIKGARLRVVEQHQVKDEDEMRELFAQFIADGQEGLMLRHGGTGYEHKRTDKLLKVKERQDAEYAIKGVDVGRGKLAAAAIFVFQTPEGHEFRAKMVGEIDNLKRLFAHRHELVGKKATVAFQGLSADGIPRFPVVLRLHHEI